MGYPYLDVFNFQPVIRKFRKVILNRKYKEQLQNRLVKEMNLEVI